MTAQSIPVDATVYIARHRGLVGSAIWRFVETCGFIRLLGATSREADLRDLEAPRTYFQIHRPRVVIDAAARVGGIVCNSTQPVEFLSCSLRI